MKSLTSFICVFALFLFVTNNLFAQETSDDEETAPIIYEQRKIYLGIGMGFDYGGLGAKLEYMPQKHFGIFGGLGYNLSSAGFNVGCAYKIQPDKKTCPNILAFYGYNAVFKGEDSYAQQYDMTSYGFTFGASIDFLVGNDKKNKVSLGLFVPIRSKKFRDNYDRAKEDRYLDIKGELIPVGISIGYNWGL